MSVLVPSVTPSPIDVKREITIVESFSYAVSRSSTSNFGIMVKKTASGQHSFNTANTEGSGKSSTDEEDTEGTVTFLLDKISYRDISATEHISTYFNF